LVAEGTGAMNTTFRNVIVAAALLLPQAAWAENTAAPADRCNRGQFRVLLDVGHTAEVPGAVSARGANEFDFNRKLAGIIKDRLVDAGFARTTVMVVSGKAKPGLFKRVAIANKAPPDLFLSIHHDSVPQKFKETWEYEGKQAQFSDRFKGHSIFISNENAEPKASLQFAHLLGEKMKARGLQYTPHYKEPFMGDRQRILVDEDVGVYRYDQLIVLRMTRMPAVLLEAGSIINREEELQMATPERQVLIGDSVTEAVAQFCNERQPAEKPVQAKRPGKPEAVSAAAAPPRR
jgi:N-acetylmuramoyl-L-alanine amidase